MENYYPNRWAQTHTEHQSHQDCQNHFSQWQNWLENSNGNCSIGQFPSGEYHDSFQNRTQTYFGGGWQNFPRQSLQNLNKASKIKACFESKIKCCGTQDYRQYGYTQDQNYRGYSNQFSQNAGWDNLNEASKHLVGLKSILKIVWHAGLPSIHSAKFIGGS